MVEKKRASIAYTKWNWKHLVKEYASCSAVFGRWVVKLIGWELAAGQVVGEVSRGTRAAARPAPTRSQSHLRSVPPQIN